MPLRTNRWGLHDKEYAQTPPAGCFRMALLGASHAMGSGVRREDTFEAVVEARLNREAGGDPGCYEILNFSVYGYTPLYQIDVLNSKVVPVPAECHPVCGASRTMPTASCGSSRSRSGRKARCRTTNWRHSWSRQASTRRCPNG